MRWRFSTIIALLIVMSLLPTRSTAGQDEYLLTVANWKFKVHSAVKSAQISDTAHLGALEDGRDWLIVTMTGTNTSEDEQEIHSDMVQLRAGGEMIKQTGKESESVADELGFISIGGTFPHDIPAGEVIQIVQVYKVAPELSEFTLVFDFNGKWEVPIGDLVSASAGNPRVLIGDSPEQESSSMDDPTDSWSVTTSKFQLTLIGATMAPMFVGDFHLGILDNGQSWLVVTYGLENKTSGEIEVNSDSISILSQGEVVSQAGDETRSVASELGLAAPSLELDSNEKVTVVQVFKVKPDALDNTLQIEADGNWFISLRPVLEITNGDPSAIIPDSALDLATLEGNGVQAVPTTALTPTPEPTSTPEPTAPPRYGSAENPAQFGETLEADGMAVTVLSGYYTYDYNFSTPKGGYVFLILEVQLQDVGDETMSYSDWNFAAKDLHTGVDFDDTFALLDTPLGSGELSPGEYVYGQVALEIQETASSVRVKYTVGQGLFSSGEPLYWMVPRQ